MIDLINKGTYVQDGIKVLGNAETAQLDKEDAQKKTLAYRILSDHNIAEDHGDLKLKFDALVSHDITYVGIIQTARASGLEYFPVPYALTNCHNSLCAVGGTINEDDHMFGLSAAKKYGGIYVPANLAVIHQYAREMMASCGGMILGSDSHTRYGALGTMGFGEGGPELVKQILNKTYDTKMPEVIAVYLEGNVQPGVGPQDVALAIIGAVFDSGFVKSKVMEFIGPGIENLSVDFRNGIDVMTTETTCLSSIWMTDDLVEKYYTEHRRPDSFKKIRPEGAAHYDGMLRVNLSEVVPMIALPFHPSNVYKISEFKDNAKDIMRKVEKDAGEQFENLQIDDSLTKKVNGNKVLVDQGIVAGCAGGSFENLDEVAAILNQGSIGCESFSFSVYPASQPVYLSLLNNGIAESLLKAGSVIKPAFCGPCFGAGDTPANEAFSIRHATRNFPNREGSNPGDGQISYVALMDSRSIAATALNKGLLTGADELNYEKITPSNYSFDHSIYEKRVYNGYGSPKKSEELFFGPNIADWPEMIPLPEDLLLKVASVIDDPVTTTDELIPSGETSSYRSNPYRLAEFTLSRKDPQYVDRAKAIQKVEKERLEKIEKNGDEKLLELIRSVEPNIDAISDSDYKINPENTGVGSVIYAVKPGDGSAREQAASCQKVLGGWANICLDYATRRYRSNLINWGIIPFTVNEKIDLSVNDSVFIPGLRSAILGGSEEVKGYLISNGKCKPLLLNLGFLTRGERDILAAGSLINYYRNEKLREA